MTFERDKTYRTRGGGTARVICVDAPGDRPIIALHGTIVCFHAHDGRNNPSDKYAQDLIPECGIDWFTLKPAPPQPAPSAEVLPTQTNFSPEIEHALANKAHEYLSDTTAPQPVPSVDEQELAWARARLRLIMETKSAYRSLSRYRRLFDLGWNAALAGKVQP